MKESGYKTNRDKHQIVFIETNQNKEYNIKYSYDYVTLKTLCHPYKHTKNGNGWSYNTKILYKRRVGRKKETSKIQKTHSQNQ